MAALLAKPDRLRPTPLGDFRHALRQSTRSEHKALDHRLSKLDITTREGLAEFCALHLACFERLSLRSDHDLLPPLITALIADLAALGGAATRPNAADPGVLDPLAVAYIVDGSRLGTQVLRHRWAVATDSQVRAAAAYFSLPFEKTRWPATCQALSRVPVGSLRARRIANDARRLFDMFNAGARQIA
ncbi:MAG: hypothetical protein AAF631_02150 [Pseudomonadota bacterium]